MPESEVLRIILASASSARHALLEQAGISHIMHPVGLDETALKTDGRSRGETTATVACRLAAAKASAISADRHTIVIGADQMLSCNDQWFDKPGSLAQARTQLLALRGQTHRLHTAVSLYRGGQEIASILVEPHLTMRLFSHDFLDRYLEQEGEFILGCVGAYRLEGMGCQLFSRIEGQHDAILGLPLLPVLDVLRQQDYLLR